MKVIFNSDLIYAHELIKELPRRFHDFLVACNESGHEVIIPLTALLEFQKKQGDFLAKEMIEIKNANTLFQKYNIETPSIDPEKLPKLPDLVQLIRDTGITCKIEEPTLQDYNKAHQRACLHENPKPPQEKSDEMRDLVIWDISIRIAKENDSTLLMSQDKVHTHTRGDNEASDSNLIRCQSFERGYEALDIATESSKEIRLLLEKVWDTIVERTPVSSGGQIVSIKNPIFRNAYDGTQKVKCELKISSGDGKDINASLEMKYYNEKPYKISISKIIVDKQTKIDDINLEFDQPGTYSKKIQDALDNLKNITSQ